VHVNFTQCDSLLIGDQCWRSYFVPYVGSRNPSRLSSMKRPHLKFSDEQMFLLVVNEAFDLKKPLP